MTKVSIPAFLFDAAMAEADAMLKKGLSGKAVYDIRAKARKGAATPAKIITIHACNAAIMMIENDE